MFCWNSRLSYICREIFKTQSSGSLFFQVQGGKVEVVMVHWDGFEDI